METSSKTTTVVTISETSIELSEDAHKALTAFIEARDAIKALESQKEAAEEILRAELGSAQFGTFNGLKVVKVMSQVRRGIDAKRLREQRPEVAEEFATASPYTFLKTL